MLLTKAQEEEGKFCLKRLGGLLVPSLQKVEAGSTTLSPHGPISNLKSGQYCVFQT